MGFAHRPHSLLGDRFCLEAALLRRPLRIHPTLLKQQRKPNSILWRIWIRSQNRSKVGDNAFAVGARPPRRRLKVSLHTALTVLGHPLAAASSPKAERLKYEKRKMKPIERKMPSISYIVARSSPGGLIGCENKLPWRLRTDLKFFRSVTENHVVIMGRKTLESLGRPLPNRINIVLSSNTGVDTEQLIWARNPEMALFIADYISIIKEKSQIMVIGGAQIYEVFREQFTRIYLTEVLHDFGEGDAYFKESFDLREWEVLKKNRYPASEFDEFDFTISILEKKRKYTRHRELEEFYVNGELDKVKSDFENFIEKFNKSPKVKDGQILLPLLVA